MEEAKKDDLKMEKEFEELKIGIEQFKGGDFVLNKWGQHLYKVGKTGETFFHKHKFIEVTFDDGHKQRMYFDKTLGKRAVLRRINVIPKS